MRTIKVINGATQKTYELSGEFTTLADVKAKLKENDVDTDNLEWLEGKSRTKLISDESVLPSNILYRGERTDDLLILMNPLRDKIKNGADDISRKEAYDLIKKLNLQGEVIKVTGVNFTRAKTAELIKIINKAQSKKEVPVKKAIKETPKEAPKETLKPAVFAEDTLKKANLEERVKVLEEKVNILLSKAANTEKVVTKKSDIKEGTASEEEMSFFKGMR